MNTNRHTGTSESADQSVSSQSGVGALNQLFESLRETEPRLAGENFTKMVLNSINSGVKRERFKSAARTGISFDLLGLLIGAVCAYFFVGKPDVVEFVLNVLPSSIVITPLLAIAAVVSMAVLSFAAWWVVEEGSRV